MNKILGIVDVAKLLGISELTLKCDVSRRPETLPPRIKFPGSRRIRWRERDVLAWIERHVSQ